MIRRASEVRALSAISVLELISSPCPTALVENKLKYIVIHWPAAGLFPWSPEDGQTTQYMKAYPVLYPGDDATVLGVD